MGNERRREVGRFRDDTTMSITLVGSSITTEHSWHVCTVGLQEKGCIENYTTKVNGQ